jgi:hypothetical protein
MILTMIGSRLDSLVTRLDHDLDNGLLMIGTLVIHDWTTIASSLDNFAARLDQDLVWRVVDSCMIER